MFGDCSIRSIIITMAMINFIIALAFISINGADASQKFVPNGRYGRRSDPSMAMMMPLYYDSVKSIDYLPPFLRNAAGIGNNGVVGDNQEGKISNVNWNNNNNNILWQQPDIVYWTLKQLWCASIEDKTLMIQCYKSFPLFKHMLLAMMNDQPSPSQASSSSSSLSSSLLFPLPLLPSSSSSASTASSEIDHRTLNLLHNENNIDGVGDVGGQQTLKYQPQRLQQQPQQPRQQGQDQDHL